MSKLWPINHFPQLKLLEPGLKLLEGFTTHESNLACNSQVDAGYKKLLQKVESSSTFCNNICTCCTNSDLRQIYFAASDVKPVMTWLPLNFFQSEVSSHATCNNLKSLRLRFQTVTIMCSLRSKHFCLVSEQRKTEEGDFRFWPREKWNESQKKKKNPNPNPNPNALPALLLALFSARSFTCRSSFFGPKPHRNTCYAGYIMCKKQASNLKQMRLN